MTNGDKIRAMTDEELAKLLEDSIIEGCPTDAKYVRACNNWYDNCEGCWLAWLRRDETYK